MRILKMLHQSSTLASVIYISKRITHSKMEVQAMKSKVYQFEMLQTTLL